MLAKKISIEHKGRKCKYPGCKKSLSIYNHNTQCHAHINESFKTTQWQNSVDGVKQDS